MWEVFVVLIGLGAGIFSSFFGVGGGIIMAPALYAVLPQAPPSTVIGTSLGVIFCNSLINTFSYMFQGQRPRARWAVPLGLGGGVGGLAGSALVGYLHPCLLKWALGAFLVFSAIRPLKAPGRVARGMRGPGAFLLVGMASGMLCGLTGLGGGAILVPALSTLIKAPIQWVPLYSNVGMIFTAGAGAWGTMANIDGGLMAVLLTGSLLGAQVGVRLNRAVSQKVARRLFAFLLVSMGLQLFWSGCQGKFS